jgi:hypothetical protein
MKVHYHACPWLWRSGVKSFDFESIKKDLPTKTEEWEAFSWEYINQSSMAAGLTVEPTNTWGTVEPANAWITVDPANAWIPVEPTNAWSTVDPTNSWSTVEPTTEWSTVEPTNAWSTVEPTNSWGTASVEHNDGWVVSQT